MILFVVYGIVIFVYWYLLVVIVLVLCEMSLIFVVVIGWFVMCEWFGV